MLSSAKLTNIQAHESLRLEFGPGLNVIHGSTDSGKTAVLRGLLWALLNDGSGDKLLKNNNGAKNCEVDIVLDGHAIKRAWSKSANTFEMDGVGFSAFRTAVPAAIAEVINMDSINVQRRRDVPFMVYWKATDNADQFSQMLDIDEINRSITTINKDVRDAQQATTALEDDIILTKQKADEMAWLDDALAEFDYIEKEAAIVHNKQGKLDGLLKTLAEYHALDNAATALEDSTHAASAIVGLIDSKSTITQLSSRLQQLGKTAETYKLEHGRCTALKTAGDCHSDIIGLCDTAKDLAATKARHSRLATLVSGHSWAEEAVAKRSYGPDSLASIMAICASATAIQGLVAKRNSVQASYGHYQAQKQHFMQAKQLQDRTRQAFEAAMPDVCPLCGAEGCKHP